MTKVLMLVALKEAELINCNRLTKKCHMSLPQFYKFLPEALMLLTRLSCKISDWAVFIVI